MPHERLTSHIGLLCPARARTASGGWRGGALPQRYFNNPWDYLVIVIHARLVGIPVFGPSQLAARMEGSKAFSKAFMDRHNIPTAKFRVFTASEYDQAVEYVKTCGFQVVLKASGLAAGKGVLIPETVDEAIAGLKEIMVDNVFGSAGPRPCHVYIVCTIHTIFLSHQVTRLLSRNSSLVRKFLCSLSRTGTLLSLCLLLRTTSASVRATPVLTPVEWAHMHPRLWLLLRSWTVL